MVQTCRFCATSDYVTIDLKETSLHEKLVRYFPLKFDSDDILPKVCCAECASMIQSAEDFVLRAQEVENDFRSRLQPMSSSKNLISTKSIRSLTSSAAVQALKPTPPSVCDVLKKLNASSAVVIKRVDKQKPPIKKETDYISELPLAMTMEVLDDEVENLKTEDFVQFNDTDDDEEGEVNAERSFRQIVSVDVKNVPFYGEDSSQDGFIDEGRLEDTSDDEDYKPPQTKIKSSPKKVKDVKTDRKQRSPGSKGIVIRLTDPCHYVCVTCKAKFAKFEDLQAHIDQNLSCKKVNCTCEHCGKVCDSRRALYQHRMSHNPKPQFVCDQCGKIYTNSFNLENHKSQVHGEEVEELGYVYKCCEKTFPTRRELNEHISTHTKLLNLLCDTCGKSFTSHKALRSHNMSHQNIRPFSCDLCDKSFRTKLLLVQHSHVHTGIKVFNCDVCDKSFAKKESLKKHYKLHSNDQVTWSSTGEKITVRPIEQMQQQAAVEENAQRSLETEQHAVYHTYGDFAQNAANNY
ncbi:zinc finger protein 16-like [Uranotaenia lowii]|uniref:zinc finger protein 16-like n=1 Tax=Uranotaenia lowii TaxID=190385 RepID=UPI00247AFED8|nr:zinc finger protein 16-like [Uranotaenia lowii]